MTDPSKPRLAIDLDDLERQLRRSGEAPAPKKDPLAELARIVGQDDPFRKLLGETDAPPARSDVRPRVGPEPSPVREPLLTAEEEDLLHGAKSKQPPQHSDEPFDAGRYSEPPYAPLEPVHGGYAQDHEDHAEEEPKRSRKGLLAIGVVLGLAVLGVGGYALTRSGGARLASGGEPPLVRADTTPSKIAPQNPGGVEIPNQNKQIFDRAAPEDKTRVVDRQEQPVDVRQAARNIPPPPSEAGARPPSASTTAGQGATGPTSAAPPRPNTVLSVLGEPKRVRTVAVKPDGSIDSPATTGAAADPVVPAPGPALPPASNVSGSTPTAATPPAPAQRPRSAPPAFPMTTATTPASTPSSPSRTEPPRAALPEAALPSTPSAPGRSSSPPAPAVARPTPTEPPAVANRPKPPEPPRERVAAAEPPRTAPAEAATGGFAVQIGTRPSEAEARAAFDQLSTRFASVLSGQSPLIRRAELNGKTVYRVRIGPTKSRAEAVDLCVRLKAAGGECFVAAN